MILKVNSVSWAPFEHGPILACASSDSKVSVVTFNSESCLSIPSCSDFVFIILFLVPSRKVDVMGFHRKPCVC